MVDPQSLKQLMDQSARAVRMRPGLGQGTARTRVRVRAGLTCDIEDGDWKLVADEMPDDGGAGLGPDPGVFGRAALGSCLAMGYVFWAARLDVAIESVAVDVEADYDARGMLGVNDTVRPGWSAMRYTVHIVSGAPEAAIREVVQTADRYSSLLDCFNAPVPVVGDLVIETPGLMVKGGNSQ